MADFSWNCAVQQFKHESDSASAEKDFTDVARGFHFSSEFKLRMFVSTYPGQDAPIQGHGVDTMQQLQQTEQVILNEVNLGFFLAAVSYLHNFKAGSKQQGDLLSSRDSLR